MDANHQDKTSHNLATTEDVEWVLSKKSKLLIPQHKNQTRVSKGWTGFSRRTLWDWIQFFAVLAIPIIVAAGTLYFTQQITFQQAQLSIIANEKQHQSDTLIAQDQQQEAALQTYLDRMSDLLLNQNLRSSKPGDEVRIVARSRTLTVLSQLNAARKSAVITFLYEAGLISGNNIVISLANANLVGVTFQGDTLIGTDLSGANLEGANLQYTDLFNVNFNSANLIDANLANSELINIQFEETQLNNSDLSNIFLFHSDLSHASLDNVNLTEALLLDVNMFNSNLENVNLINSTLVNIDFTFSYMINSKLNSALLSGCKLIHSYLSGADFENTNLLADGVKFLNTTTGYVDGVTFPISDGSQSYFFDNPFFQIKPSMLYIHHQPIDTDLLLADLTHANLSRAKVTNAQLAKAASLKGATMPDGTIHP